MRLIAVVLAAGIGSRLRPLSDTVPKCLLEVGGRTLLDRLLDAFAEAGLSRAVIVTGHHGDRVASHARARRGPPAVSCCGNPRYDVTNNAASLAAARAGIGGEGFVLSDADVLFSVSPVPALIAHPDVCALAVDRGAAHDPEAMKVQAGLDGAVLRIAKALAPGETAGESIGVQKIGAAAAPLLWDAVDAVVSRAPATAYYEDAFQLMIDRGVRFGISPVEPGSWTEIDDLADLAGARERFAG